MRIAVLLPVLLLALSSQAQNEVDRGIDLVFLVDDTASIEAPNFALQKQFLNDLVDQLNVGTGQTQAQVGLTKFGLDGTNAWYLNTHTSKAPLKQAISNLPFGSQGTTVLAKGMSTALEQWTQSANGARQGVARIMLITTDGRDRSDVTEQQRRAARNLVGVHAIGIGSRVDRNQLATATGSLGRVYSVDRFDQLSSLVNTIVDGVFRERYCFNNGELSCFCNANFTGLQCEIPKNLCDQAQTCSGRGQCMYQPDTGSWCVCNPGWLGPNCDTPDGETVYAGKRCYIQYGTQNPSSDCEDLNANIRFRCVPDNFDCLFIPCPEPTNIGWCSPEPPENGKPPLLPKAQDPDAWKPQPLPIQDDAGCKNGGTGMCECPFTHTGPRCEHLFNWCEGGDGVHNNEPCGAFGTCTFDAAVGSQCVCNAGWTGTYCSEPIEGQTFVSRRCWFSYGMGNPSLNCTGTVPKTRCIVDNPECATQNCPEPTNIGWCIPNAAGDTIIKSWRKQFAPKMLVYDDPLNAVRFNSRSHKRK